MMRITRSFTFLLSLLFALGLAGCAFPDSASSQNSIYDLYGEPDESDDDDAADDDDSLPDGPGDDDDASGDDDDATEPDGAPCFGRSTDGDFDCDGVPDSDDPFNTDPNEARVLWHDSVAPDAAEIDVRQVGYGYGDADENNGWSYENGQAVRYEGSWVIVEVAPGIYRVNLLEESGGWGMFGEYCEYGVYVDDTTLVFDPACMYDAGCEAQDIPPGWAMTFAATDAYTRRLTPDERDEIPLAEDDCLSVSQ